MGMFHKTGKYRREMAAWQHEQSQMLMIENLKLTLEKAHQHGDWLTVNSMIRQLEILGITVTPSR